VRRDVAAAIATNRFGLGARPGELDAAAGDPRAWLLAQVRAPYVAPPELAGLAPSHEVLASFLEARETREAARRALSQRYAAPDNAAPGGTAAGSGAPKRRAASSEDAGGKDDGAGGNGDPVAAIAQGVRRTLLPHHVAQVSARTRLALTTAAPFRERLVHFWSNHFAVSVDKPICLGLAGAMENEAIRPNVTGNFADLLLAVERHPAMIVYLDNQRSVGPGSKLGERAGRRSAAQGARVGINENLAREILELHTLGVDGGYSQQDVTTFARVITGWSIGGGRGRLAEGTPGAFTFREALHEPGAKTVLGRHYPQTGEAQGVAVLKDLARHPSTARHLATKLARHFVADEPPPALVDRLARAYTKHDGALLPVYEALVTSDEAWREPPAKFKTPQDFAFSALRAFDAVPREPRLLMAPFELMGQPQFRPGSPAGWPDRAQDWDGADALMKRIEWSVALAARLGDSRAALDAAASALGGYAGESLRTALTRAASGSQALALLVMSPEFQRR
jgi:uncharacterized protein (DUF1800 family)